MSGNNHKGKLKLAPPPPTEVAHLKITAFADKPPVFESTADLVGTLRLLGAGLTIMAFTIEQMNKKAPPGPPEDKPRKYLGPRD